MYALFILCMYTNKYTEVYSILIIALYIYTGSLEYTVCISSSDRYYRDAAELYFYIYISPNIRNEFQ